MLKLRSSVPQAIREAVDFCPGGLCFSMPDGRPVLVNRQMNRLAVQLTGHTVLDAETTWNELRNLTSFNGCSRLEKPWTETRKKNRASFWASLCPTARCGSSAGTC
jgi:hypothetical protein